MFTGPVASGALRSCSTLLQEHADRGAHCWQSPLFAEPAARGTRNSWVTPLAGHTPPVTHCARSRALTTQRTQIAKHDTHRAALACQLADFCGHQSPHSSSEQNDWPSRCACSRSYEAISTSAEYGIQISFRPDSKQTSRTIGPSNARTTHPAEHGARVPHCSLGARLSRRSMQIAFTLPTAHVARGEPNHETGSSPSISLAAHAARKARRSRSTPPAAPASGVFAVRGAR